MSSLKLYLAICKQQGNSPRHWILMLREDGTTNCTWYHVTGGPSRNKNYKLEIPTKRFDSQGVAEHHELADIDPKDVNKIKAAVQKEPVKFCQRWAVDVMDTLERKRIVPAGTTSTWYDAMESDPYSDDGAPKSKAGRSGSATASSTSGQGQSSAAASTGPEWIWDMQAQRYRYFDTRTNQWVWR